MRKEYFNYVRVGVWLLLVLLVGLPNVMVAAGQQEELVISKTTEFEEDLVANKLTIRADNDSPDLIEIYLQGASKIENIVVEKGAKADIIFMGDKESVWGDIMVEEGADLTIGRLGYFPKQLTVGTTTNNGRLVDETGAVWKVAGVAGFEITGADAFSKMGELFIHSEMKMNGENLEVFPTVGLQKWIQSSWKQEGGETSGTEVSFQVAESGTYRIKWVCDNENGAYTELYSKDIELLKIEGDKDLKDSTYHAIAFHSNVLETKKISMDNVKASPCTTEEKAAGFSVSQLSNLELTLKGTNSQLGVLRNHGTMTLKNTGNAQLEGTVIYNEGQFTDETGVVGTKILGPAGLWIKEFGPSEDITAPDETLIKGIHCQYATKHFVKKIFVEVFKDNQWVDYNEIKGSESDNENPVLKSAKEGETENWPTNLYFNFTTAQKGTYRFKIQTTNEECVTTWYSQPYELIASEFEIKENQQTLGNENGIIIPSLLISAGKEAAEAVEATLQNIEITEHAEGTPSVRILKDAKVNLMLKGTNDLGSILSEEGSIITLKPETAGEDMSEKLSISSIRNGGSFTDETATVSSVKDLNNRTMIEFTDTTIYQIGDMISVTLGVEGNSATGNYMLLGTPMMIQKLNANNTWENYYSKSLLLADESVNNPDQSSKTRINLTTTEAGTYRMKVTSEDIDNDAHNATLYFMFKIVKLENEIKIVTIDGTSADIDGTSDAYKDANLLIFSGTGIAADPAQVTLNNVQLTQKEGYEEYTSSVVTENQNYELTLNGVNDLATFIVEEGATATLKKGDTFESLDATVYNAGKFTDETGTIQKVVDSNGLTMVAITGYGMPAWNGYSVKVNFDFFFGSYETIKPDEALEHLVDGAWTSYNSVVRSTKSMPEGGDPESGEIAYTYTGLKEGQYRVKIQAEEWKRGVEEGSKENPHTVTLYHYFTISEPAPEPTYYSITLPSVEGAATSPAAGTYWETEGSSFSFSLTLDPAYDQSKPEVKANGQVVSPSENGTYTIANISGDVTITIEGIAENTPTGNVEVDEDSVKVWGADGILHLYTPVKAKVWVYTLNGVLVRAVDEVIGNQTISLASGSYIIVIDDQKYKLRF